jgi:hypothetical protein
MQTIHNYPIRRGNYCRSESDDREKKSGTELVVVEWSGSLLQKIILSTY